MNNEIIRWMTSFCKLNFSPRVNKFVCKEAHAFAPISNQANMQCYYYWYRGLCYVSASLANVVNQIYN